MAEATKDRLKIVRGARRVAVQVQSYLRDGCPLDEDFARELLEWLSVNLLDLADVLQNEGKLADLARDAIARRQKEGRQ